MKESSQTQEAALEMRLRRRHAHIISIMERFKFRASHAGIATSFGFAVALLFTLIVDPDEGSSISSPVLIIVFIFGSLSIYASFVYLVRDFGKLQLRAIERDLSSVGVEQLQQDLEDDFFTKLVKINFKYIDQYYLQTQSQADKSFKLCLLVAVVGFLAVAAGVALMFRGQVQPAYLVTASGVLTEFIAAVFFFLYNRTILKMAEYHRKLVLTQNISVALKIAEGLPESDRARVQEQLVLRLSENVNQLLVQDSSDVRNSSG